LWKNKPDAKSPSKGGYLNYDRLHIYPKTLDQEKYQILRDWTKAVKQLSKKEVAVAGDIIPADKLNSKERSIMVFDDVMIEKQGPIEKYFCLGRHGGADCFYHATTSNPKQCKSYHSVQSRQQGPEGYT